MMIHNNNSDLHPSFFNSSQKNPNSHGAKTGYDKSDDSVRKHGSDNKNSNTKINSIFSIKVYLKFFLSYSFILAISFLFYFKMRENKSEDWVISSMSLLTFVNLCVLTLIHTIFSGLSRKFNVEKPVKKILKATEELAGGKFDTRIEPRNIPREYYNEFDLIIDNFNIMAHELEGTEILRHDFISNVSHEFKSPLAAIQNYSVLLQDPALTEEKRIEYAMAVNYSCARLSSLITNILKLNKLENQKIFCQPERYDLSEHLYICMLDFEPVWERKKIEIETDIEQDIFVESDAELLSLVWNNLLSNAMKFTDEGGTVFLSLKEYENYVAVCVKDTGCGMSLEAQKHIYEKFYQGDTSHASEGNGLGLALVKTVIDIVKGELIMKSEEGRGTEFIVRIPGGSFFNNLN